MCNPQSYQPLTRCQQCTAKPRLESDLPVNPLVVMRGTAGRNRVFRRDSVSSSTVTSSMRTLLRALFLPSLLLSGRRSDLPMQFCGVTSSDARMAPLLTNIPGLGQSGPFDDASLAKRAHSHNDYHQEVPLASALHHGIKSVEVDVFPRNDELWVGHTRFELDPSRTIENLYIEPILNLMQRPRGLSNSDPRVTAGSDGRPFPVSRSSQRMRMKSQPTNQDLIGQDDDSLTLLVDFKADPEESVSLLQQSIAPLRPYLSRVDKKGIFHKGQVTVLVSGTRPKQQSLVTQDGDRFIFIDGRASDIQGNTDTTLVPMVSLPWRTMQLARLFGRGENYLNRMVKQAHQQGKRVRIWGAPNREGLWRQMMRNNVDLLSIDDHSKFARFASRFGFRR